MTISKDSDYTDKQKVFYLFGEHARELISPETGLNLIKALCGETRVSGFNVDAILEKNTFKIVLNANPIARDMVLAGEFCKRTNEDNVDLNRNWDAHWEPVTHHIERVIILGSTWLRNLSRREAFQ